jgi:hypothetical protein
MNIDSLINESIDKVILQEKFKRGEKHFSNHSEEQKENPTASRESVNLIKNLFNKDLLNVAAFARYVFPNHTEEGAQSQLRKAIKGLDSSGDKSAHPIRMTKQMVAVITSLTSEELQI